MRLKVLGSAEDALRAMTEQLIEKLMKLDQLLKNQEEFMGSFAHEMKTPTNVRALDSGIPGENKMGAIEVLLGG